MTTETKLKLPPVYMQTAPKKKRRSKWEIAADKLEKVVARLSGNWIRNAWAKDAQGFDLIDKYDGDEEAAAKDPEACKWCMEGGLYAEGLKPGDLGWEAVKDSLPERYSESIPEYNDSRSRRWDQVKSTFDKAIASLRAK